MIIFLLVLASILLGSIELFIGIVGGTALYFVVTALQIELTSLQYFMLFTFVAAFPAAALLCGSLLDRYCQLDQKTDSFYKLGGMISFTTLLYVSTEGASLEQLLKNLSLINETNVVHTFLVTTMQAFFCGALSAFVLIGASLSFEFSANLAMQLMKIDGRRNINFEGLRIVLVLTLLTWSIHLIFGLFAGELSPAVILGMINQ